MEREVKSMDPIKAADILGIELPTEMRIAKKAFRNLAMFFHPDKGGDHRQNRQGIRAGVL